MPDPERVRELLAWAIARARTERNPEGSQNKLAELLGFSPELISRARRDGRVSARLASALHAWSRGKISRRELRPDIFGPPLKRQATMEARGEE